MDKIDKDAKLGDCTFLLLTKLPSGNVHQVLIDHTELKQFLQTRTSFKVDARILEEVNFTPYYEKNNSNNS